VGTGSEESPSLPRINRLNGRASRRETLSRMRQSDRAIIHREIRSDRRWQTRCHDNGRSYRPAIPPRNGCHPPSGDLVSARHRKRWPEQEFARVFANPASVTAIHYALADWNRLSRRPLGDPCAHGPLGFAVISFDPRSIFRSPPEPPASKAVPAPCNRTVHMRPFCNGVNH
jgi:hypothetical protein